MPLDNQQPETMSEEKRKLYEQFFQMFHAMGLSFQQSVFIALAAVDGIYSNTHEERYGTVGAEIINGAKVKLLGV